MRLSAMVLGDTIELNQASGTVNVIGAGLAIWSIGQLGQLIAPQLFGTIELEPGESDPEVSVEVADDRGVVVWRDDASSNESRSDSPPAPDAPLRSILSFALPFAATRVGRYTVRLLSGGDELGQLTFLIRMRSLD